MSEGDRTTQTSETGNRGKEVGAPWCARILWTPDLALLERRVVLGGALRVGRAPGAGGLAIADRELSRAHLRLDRPSSGQGLTLEDLGSKNGTWADGVLVTGPQAVAEGQLLRFGGTLVELLRDRGGDADAGADPALLGTAPPQRELIERVRRVGPSDLPVLVVGETGTGKELVARRLHELSGRHGALVPVNCAAIPEALFESTLFGHRRGAFSGATQDSRGLLGEARGGTLFLDELGELNPASQAKLLRVLESGEYYPVGASQPERADVRVVCATNAGLDLAVEQGGFRRDLLARVAGVRIACPPLRERRGDIPLLVRRFLAEAPGGAPVEVAAAAVERLCLYGWPMNVRELRQLARGLALEGRRITVETLPEPLRRSRPGAPEAAPTVGREEFLALLERFGGNVSRLARQLGKDRSYVYRLARRFDIDLEGYRPLDG